LGDSDDRRCAYLSVMTIDGISIDCASDAEALDAIEEIRYLFELADDGELDMGPAFRSLLTSAYWAIDAALAPGDVPVA
jgi:hypothetical protein